MIRYSPELMASASCHLWLLTRQKITPKIFTGTSPVTGYSTTLCWYIWTGMAGWRQWVSSVGPVEIAISTPRSYYLTAMTATWMIGPHILSDTTTSPHLSSRQATPTATSQIITVPTWSWRDITAYQKWNGRDIMEPPNLLLPTYIMLLWICGIRFNKNQPLSSLMPLKRKSPAPCPTWSRNQCPSMSRSNPNAIEDEIRINRGDC